MAIITNQQLEQLLGRPVDPIHVLISKNVLVGGTAATISEMLGVNQSEIADAMQTDAYKEIYTLLAARANEQRLETSFTIDEIERKAWANVAKRLDVEKDIEVNARIAVMANRAIRRTSQMSDALDPTRASETVKITLTRRVIDSIQSERITRGAEDQIVARGRSINPTFKQVEEFFGGKTPMIQEAVEPRREQEISAELIVERLRERD